MTVSPDADLATFVEDYRSYVHPQRVAGFEAFEWAEDFVRADGAVLVDRQGREYVDMSAGFGAASLGHRPPAVLAALRQALECGLPGTMPFAIPHGTGALGKALCHRAGEPLRKVYFGNSGAEGIETALKAAMARTGRPRFVSATGGYHGLTLGALGLMASPDTWRAPFPGAPLLARQVEVGDVEGVASLLAEGDVAAVVLEPIQGVGGGLVWSEDAAQAVRALCRRYGALLVMDEVLTGLGRTGHWFAFQGLGPALAPDIVVTSKGLTGGLVPLSAVLMTDAVYDALFGGPSGAGVHGSTFSGNLLAMAAGLSVLRSMDDAGILARVAVAGRRLHAGLQVMMQEGLPILDVRGNGLLQFARIHGLASRDDSDGALACVRTLRDLGVIATVAPHAPSYLKLTPPLTIGDDLLDAFLDRLREVLELIQEELGEQEPATSGAP